MCFFFSGYVAFSQTYKGEGVTIIRSGSAITVKWSNINNVVITKKAQCETATYDNFNGIEIELRKCNCTGSSDYFIVNFNNDISKNQYTSSIRYFNELGSMYWQAVNMYKQ